jgi:hypothetical protein
MCPLDTDMPPALRLADAPLGYAAGLGQRKLRPCRGCHSPFLWLRRYPLALAQLPAQHQQQPQLHPRSSSKSPWGLAQMQVQQRRQQRRRRRLMVEGMAADLPVSVGHHPAAAQWVGTSRMHLTAAMQLVNPVSCL